MSKHKSAPVLSAKELRVLLDETLLVRHISVPLAVFGAEEVAKTVLSQMSLRNFDAAAVKSEGEVSGYLLRADLTSGHCKNHVKAFSHADIVSSDTPLVKILPMLAQDRTFLFVLNRTEIDEIVTPSDLQKAPVRMALFGMVTLLEMYMLWMVRICYPDETFKSALRGRLTKAEQLLADRKHRNVEIDLADCLQMCDKRELLLKVPGFFEHIGFGSKKKAAEFFAKSEHLRDELAHAQDINGSSWGEVANMTVGIEAFLKQVEEGTDKFIELFRDKGPQQ